MWVQYKRRCWVFNITLWCLEQLLWLPVYSCLGWVDSLYVELSIHIYYENCYKSMMVHVIRYPKLQNFSWTGWHSSSHPVVALYVGSEYSSADMVWHTTSNCDGPFICLYNICLLNHQRSIRYRFLWWAWRMWIWLLSYNENLLELDILSTCVIPLFPSLCD